MCVMKLFIKEGDIMDWVYLELKDNLLFEEDGTLYCESKFEDYEEANQYLIDNDLRATIK